MTPPVSPEEHVAAIPGVMSAVVEDGRMLVTVDGGLDATTVALRAAIVLNALGAGLPVEVAGGRRTPPPAPRPPVGRLAGVSMTTAARVACAAVLAGSAGIAAISDLSGPLTPTVPPFFAATAAPHRRTLPTAPVTGAPRITIQAPSASSPPPPAPLPPVASAPALVAPVPADEGVPAARLLVAIRPDTPASPTTASPKVTPAPASVTPSPAPTVPAPVAPVTTSVPPGTVVIASAKPPVIAPTPPSEPTTSSAKGDGENGHGTAHGDHHHGDDGRPTGSSPGDGRTSPGPSPHSEASPHHGGGCTGGSSAHH